MSDMNTSELYELLDEGYRAMEAGQTKPAKEVFSRIRGDGARDAKEEISRLRGATLRIASPTSSRRVRQSRTRRR